MPSDYQRISEENGRKYGTDIGRIGPTLLGNRYADRTHFVFELLQNAEDALRRRGGAEGSGRVRFALANGAVRFSHFGLPFTPDDVRAVCGIIEGTKEDDLIAIGRFGIGFKSVYAVTDLPQIHSGDEHFAVRDYVHPAAVDPIPLADGETVIALTLQGGDEDAADEVAEQFERLGEERTLLFLREIDEIEWSVEDGAYGYCRREETAKSEGVRRVTLLSSVNGADPVEEIWLVFSREVHHEGTSAGYAELAFRITTANDGSEAIHVIGDSPLAAFFPTVIETHLGMLVQGPYRTTPSRETFLGPTTGTAIWWRRPPACWWTPCAISATAVFSESTSSTHSRSAGSGSPVASSSRCSTRCARRWPRSRCCRPTVAATCRRRRPD